MRRVFAFIASMSLASAAVGAAEPAAGRADSGTAETARTARSARQLFDEGREHYLRGRYAEAVVALEAAAGSRGDLSSSDRNRLQEYLERARSKSGPAAAADDVVARAQSADRSPPSGIRDAGSSTAAAAPNAGTAARPETAKKLLSEARQKFNQGKITEAETLAQNCRKLGVHWRMFADNPEKLLEEIKESRRQETAWKKDSSSVDARRNRSNYLLTRARQVLEEGDTATADRLVHEAEQIKVQRKLTDLKPEQLRQQLAKKPASSRKPSGVVQADGLELAGTKRPDIRQVVAADNEEDALELPADSAPEISPLARTPAAAGKSARPASPAKEGAKDSPAKAGGSKADRDQAQELLKQAEALLAEGRTQEARAKVQKAEKLDVAYEDALALTPDYLTAMIDRAERDTLMARNEKPPASKALSSKDPSSRDPEPKAIASKLTADRQKAQTLTRQAEADLEAGRREEAKAKAAQARDIDVAYDLLEKTPEDVLEATEETDRRYLAGGGKRPPSALVPADDDLPEMATDDIAEASASAGNEMEDFAVARPELSALDCYQRGREAMRKGNSELATKFYLQAAQSGERLDSRKMQEIQDYLAQHRGKAKKKIQLLGTRPASRNGLAPEALGQGQLGQRELGQEESGRDPRFDQGGDDLPRRIDQVDEQRQIALDKLRTEVRNAEFRAERLAATDPQAALELIDQAQSSVERSGQEAAITGQLLKSLAKSRSNIEYSRKINAPKIEMAKRKQEVEETIKREEQIKVKIEQDYAEKVEKYNDLLKQKRFEEAIMLAKQAQLLMPENPTSELMVLKAKYAKQEDFNKTIREKKGDMFTESLNAVDKSLAEGYVESIIYGDPKKWRDLTARRDKYKRASNRIPTVEELKIERSLSRDVSLHFDNAPLSEVIKRLGSLAEVNIFLDTSGLEDEGVTSNTNVSINVDGIRLKSALNLILEPLRLGYTVKDDVLKITSRMKQQGELVTNTYSVADLVVPIRDFGPVQGGMGMQSSGFNVGLQPTSPGFNMGQMNVSSTGMPPPAGQAFAQLDDREGARRSGSSSGGGIGGAADGAGMHGGGVQADFNSLMNLISTTIQPDSWEELSGPGSMMPYRTTLSLVIRQTQAVHDEIADLLGQLRRLQDLQVTIEVRFVTVSDNFFERIGIDFNFNLPSTVSNGLQNTFGQPLPPFGSGNPFSLLASTAGTTGGTTGGTGGAGGGTAGGTGGAAGGAAGGAGGTAGTTGSTAGSTGSGGGGPFTPGPPIDTTNYQNWPRYGAIAGLTTQNQFTSDLTVPFKQGSFSFGVPKFGGFDPNVGLNVGFAILSDIETFFLINATQGDTRNNLLFAPKVTLFNGQTATVTDTVQRPFVTSLTPTVGFFSVGFQPQITVLPEGVSMTVQAVISADRRYVRLTVIPQFTAITDVQSFSFISGSGSNPNQQANGGVGQAGGAGGTAGGGGGGGLGGFGGGFGGGGIGGTTGTTGAGGQAQGGQQQQGQQGQTATAGNAGQQITIQRPIFEIIAVATTVSVPDGGTILLGGIKRLREGRAMGGVPILNKIPYISRLFKNTGVGRETESLMLMVTPRIIIQEEEEELLGVDLPQR